MSRKKQNQKKSTFKRFEVLNGEVSVLRTSNFDEVQEKLNYLKSESVPQIIVRDYETGNATLHTRELHQKNYRVRSEKFNPEEVLKNTEPSEEVSAELIQE